MAPVDELYLLVYGSVDADGRASLVACTGRLQASIYLGAPAMEVNLFRYEPERQLALANPGVVFEETSAFSGDYVARPAAVKDCG